MKKINKLFAIVFTFAAMQLVMASEEGIALKTAHINVEDKASLQRGAKMFTDYCLSCHSARFVRFNRVAEDLGLTEEQVMTNLNHLGVKFASPMVVTMDKHYGKKTFGAAPPDLSLVGRSRGADWLYTYLTGFYADPSKTTGFNNIAFKDVAMPNVFWRLQGTQEAVKNEEGHVEELKLVKKGAMEPEEFDAHVTDLVNFLVYISEPRQVERKRLGIWVLLFLSFFFVVAYALKKEYWKDIH